MRTLCYKNPVTKESRVVLTLAADLFIVVKVIPSSDDESSQSLKIWSGLSIERVSSYWRTKLVDHDPALVADAIKRVARLIPLTVNALRAAAEQEETPRVDVVTHVLYGPPGVGKSTLIRLLRGVDLEHLTSTEARMAKLRELTGHEAFVGGADVPSLTAEQLGAVPVLLDAGDDYPDRRAQRDAAVPSKARQPEQSMESWRRKWTLAEWPVVDARGDTTDVIARLRHLAGSRGNAT